MRPSSSMDLQLADRALGGGTHLIEVDGQVDLYSAPVLKERTLSVISGGAQRVVVDLTGVTFMDSTGLSVLVGARKRLREHDGALAIIAADNSVRRLLELTGLDQSFEIYDSLDAAVSTDDSP